MTYNPALGDFGIIKSKGIAARLIQIGTVSRWNHAFVYIGDGKIIEANPRGVAISPVSKYSKIAWNQHEELNEVQRQEIVKSAKHLVGSAYGFVDILVIGLRILGLKFLTSAFLERLAMKQGVICSELVAICYENAGVPVLNKQPHLITPGDLAEKLIYQ